MVLCVEKLLLESKWFAKYFLPRQIFLERSDLINKYRFPHLI